MDGGKNGPDSWEDSISGQDPSGWGVLDGEDE